MVSNNLKLFVRLLETFHSLECAERGASQRGSCNLAATIFCMGALCSTAKNFIPLQTTGCVLLVLFVGSFDGWC